MVVVGIILYLFDWYDRKKNGEIPQEEQTAQDSKKATSACTDESCALHSMCPSEKILKSVNKEIVYYDDEELDSFKNKGENDYTNDEVEQWRDVLYTLKKNELLDWEQSVKKRGLVMPHAIHEEFIMLYGEALQKP